MARGKIFTTRATARRVRGFDTLHLVSDDDVLHDIDDLDEAEEIAERGRMRLHLADVHLERTLLHLASGEDGEARRRLDAARELVDACGYGRRRRDVAFLEGVLG